MVVVAEIFTKCFWAGNRRRIYSSHVFNSMGTKIMTQLQFALNFLYIHTSLIINLFFLLGIGSFEYFFCSSNLVQFLVHHKIVSYTVQWKGFIPLKIKTSDQVRNQTDTRSVFGLWTSKNILWRVKKMRDKVNSLRWCLLKKTFNFDLSTMSLLFPRLF